MARPLPRNLLVDLVQNKRLLLCLDFDGALAATTSNPDDAKPIEGAVRAIRGLVGHRDDAVIAIVSGRDANTTRRMLGIFNGLYFVGLHGIELVDPDDHRELLVQVTHCLPALHTVRDWLRKEAPATDGFIVEDKEFSLALHYRNANSEVARDICRQLEYFVTRMVRGLRVMHGNMVAEVMPSNTGGIGFAIDHLLVRLKDKTLLPVYFGDDPSDEEAFFAVRRAGGATILVGAERNTHAEFLADGPAGVVEALATLAAALEPPATAATP
jgi:trehalose 6-phosphate phosphatase